MKNLRGSKGIVQERNQTKKSEAAREGKKQAAVGFLGKVNAP